MKKKPNLRKLRENILNTVGPSCGLRVSRQLTKLISAVREDERDRCGVITVSKKGMEELLEVLKNPPAPTPALKALMRGDYAEVDRLYQESKSKTK